MTKVPNAPHILSAELREVVEAFRSRSKALKNRLRSWEYSSTVDEKERLNVDLLDYARNDYRLVFWIDGLFWFRVCRMSPGKKGWILNVSFHGRWKESALPGMVEAFEQTASYLRTSSEVDEGHVKALWACVGPCGEPS
jgi:hypothetical protein